MHLFELNLLLHHIAEDLHQSMMLAAGMRAENIDDVMNGFDR